MPSLAGGQCARVTEDERLDRHQDEEPGAGEQQRGVESEYAHGQGRDGDGGEGEPEPDQGARPEAPDDLGVDDRQQNLGQSGGGEEQRERQGRQALLLLQHVGGVCDVRHHREAGQRRGQHVADVQPDPQHLAQT